jgi:hypothetical protein
MNPQCNLSNMISWKAHLLARFWFHVVPDDRQDVHSLRSASVKSKVKKEKSSKSKVDR